MNTEFVNEGGRFETAVPIYVSLYFNIIYLTGDSHYNRNILIALFENFSLLILTSPVRNVQLLQCLLLIPLTFYSVNLLISCLANERMYESSELINLKLK